MSAGLARWHTGTKAETLVFVEAVRRPLEGLADGMAEIEDKDGSVDWDVCILQCRICGHRHTAVVPHEMANNDNECCECGYMTADVEPVVCEEPE